MMPFQVQGRTTLPQGWRDAGANTVEVLFLEGVTAGAVGSRLE